MSSSNGRPLGGLFLVIIGAVCWGWFQIGNTEPMAPAGQAAQVNFPLAKSNDFVWGDVNGDGMVDDLDATDLKLFMVSTGGTGSFVLPVAPDKCYNRNDGGVIIHEFPSCAAVHDGVQLTAADVTEILQKSAGIISCFTAEAGCGGTGPEGAKSAPAGWDLSIGNVTGSPGDTVLVPINVVNAAGITGYYIYLQYDQTVLTCTGYETGSLTAAWNPTVNYQGTPGEIIATDESSSAIAGAGSLLILKFQIASNAPPGPTNIHWIDGHENDGQVPPLTDGTVTVGGVELTVTWTGNGSVVPAGGTYPAGTQVTLTATPDAGWHFDHWQGDLTGSANPTTITMDTAKSVVAVFTPPATLTVTTTGQGSVNPSNGTYPVGTSVTLTATPASGWQFSQWQGDLTGSTNPATITMNTAKSIVAVFIYQQTTLTVTCFPSQSAGAVTPPSGSYDTGSTLKLAVTPAAGWVFYQWQGDLTGSTNPATLTMDKAKSVTAVFYPTLTVTTTGQGTVALNPAAASYPAGTKVTLTASPSAGWVFDHWTGAAAGTASSAIVAMDGPKAVTAVFYPTLTVGTIGQGTVTPASGPYPTGTILTLVATPEIGWLFGNWQGDATGNASATTITMDNAKSVVAVFIPQQFTLTVNCPANQGVVTPGSGSYDAGSTVTLTATAADGWRFFGWDGATTVSANPVSLIMDSDKTITVKFVQQVTLTVTATPFGQGLVALNPPGAIYDQGATVTLQPNAANGWHFDHWENALTSTDNPASVTMDGNKAVTAVFVPNAPGTYTLNMSYKGSGAVVLSPTPTSGAYAAGTVVTLAPSPGAGWHFERWEGGLTGNANPATLTMNANQTVNAIFAQESYTLNASVTGQGAVAMDPAGGVYQNGASVSLTAIPGPDWHFDHWEGALTGAANPAGIVISANQTVTAVFVRNAFTLAVSVTGKGAVSIDPPGGAYASGTVVTLTPAPNQDWRFDHWEGALSGSVNPVQIVMTANLAISAVFVQVPQYAMPINVTGEGSVISDPAADTYEAGTSVALTAVPAANWHFDHWEGALTGNANPSTIIMNANGNRSRGSECIGKQFFG